MKPQKEMYAHLFERFHLKPEECFFVDDLQNNIDGARAVGMDGYCLADGDLKKLFEHLKTLRYRIEKAPYLSAWSCFLRIFGFSKRVEG